MLLNFLPLARPFEHPSILKFLVCINIYIFLYVTLLYLQELPVHQRADAVSSLVYEANARVRDPVYGCVGAISYLQSQVSQLQMQLAVAQAEILCIQVQQEPTTLPTQVDQDDKSLLLSDNSNYEILPQYLTFASSSSSNVFQDSDPLKRESFWT